MKTRQHWQHSHLLKKVFAHGGSDFWGVLKWTYVNCCEYSSTEFNQDKRRNPKKKSNYTKKKKKFFCSRLMDDAEGKKICEKWDAKPHMWTHRHTNNLFLRTWITQVKSNFLCCLAGADVADYIFFWGHDFLSWRPITFTHLFLTLCSCPSTSLHSIILQILFPHKKYFIFFLLLKVESLQDGVLILVPQSELQD